MGRKSGYGPTDVVLFSALASHYLQDSTQPFHGAINYDGQLTGNHGIHSRFESELIERYSSRLHLAPPAPTPITNDMPRIVRKASLDVPGSLLACSSLSPYTARAFFIMFAEKSLKALTNASEKSPPAATPVLVLLQQIHYLPGAIIA